MPSIQRMASVTTSSARRRAAAVAYRDANIGDSRVVIEALRKAAIRVEHSRSDEGSCSEALCAQGFGERRMVRRERWIGIVPDTVGGREQSGEQAAVRR